MFRYSTSIKDHGADDRARVFVKMSWQQQLPFLDRNDGSDWSFTNRYGACVCVSGRRKQSFAVMATMRIASSLIVAILIASSVYIAPDKNEYWIYFTHWSLMLLFLFFVDGAAVSLKLLSLSSNKSTTPSSLRCAVALQRVLFNVACTANVMSTIVYFIMTFGYEDGLRNPVNHVVHSVNSLLVFFEVATNAIDVRLYEVYQPIVYTFVYGTFAILYHHLTDVSIYKCFDWNAPTNRLFHLCFAFEIFTIFVYIVIYIVYYVKLSILLPNKTRL
ncbi:hypothetical protein [Alphabaculovirus myunipunctae]|uniref:Uncharacterized protein n=1 Tax=Mythimna unipuncta nucleopolyhedrovirus TaxID=447897 RepID=A0A2K9VS54_9ABAC|nr:hypothetical protein [Mythimna unipuncta nucleopolyhedrovirus]AUV65283.1 hypothetical protein [Mythimna unipuncta nucleopolyhedrovirus]